MKTFLPFLALLFLVGCQCAPPTPTATNVPMPTATVTAQPTSTPTPVFYAPTETPTLVPTRTPTSEPTATPTAVPLEGWYPLGTRYVSPYGISYQPGDITASGIIYTPTGKFAALNRADLSVVRKHSSGEFCIKACWVCPCLEWGQTILLKCGERLYEFPVYDTGSGYQNGIGNVDVPDLTFEAMGGRGRMICTLYVEEN